MMKKILTTLILLASYALASININTATKEELMSLDGIGESKANAIIEYRKAKEFKSIDELKEVSGIGEKIFNNLKDDISTSGKTTIKEKAKKKSKDVKEKAEKKGKEIKEKADNKVKEAKDKAEKKAKEAKDKASKKAKKE